MEVQHVNFRLFLRDGDNIDFDPIVPVFHGWIQDGVLNEVLVDVADYRHVPSGPGVVLIGHEANYSLDHTDGRWGLRYYRKARSMGTNSDRIKQALRRVVDVSLRLEAEPSLEGALDFDSGEIEFVIADRLLAPNDEATFDAVRPDLEDALSALIPGNEFALTHRKGPKRLFSVAIRFAHPLNRKGMLAR
ncbi:MAG: hypothetical protein AB1898_29000 [Acidobacteriota bacterium]